MKKKYIFLLLMLGILIFGGCRLFPADTIPLEIKEKYTNDDGLIHAYPSQQDTEYLSESIGLYMQYLVLVKDEKRFQEQYELLQSNYQIQKGDFYFIQWVLAENTTVNALIDEFESLLH